MKRHPLSSCFRWIIAILMLALSIQFAPAQDQPAIPAAAPPAVVQPADATAAGKTILPVQEKAAIIKLHGEVDDMMRRSLERRIDIARKAGCTVIIYELNTYGGLLTNGLEISELTRRLPTDSKMATVAWVNDKAVSCGALIAVSCQHIVMARSTVFGDCAPIKVSGDTLVIVPDTERAKFATPLLRELDESAAQNKYDRTLLHAMVDVTIEIHQIEE